MYILSLHYSDKIFREISAGLYGIFRIVEVIGGCIGAILSGFVNKSLSSKR